MRTTDMSKKLLIVIYLVYVVDWAAASLVFSSISKYQPLRLDAVQKDIIRDMPWALRSSFLKDQLFEPLPTTTPRTTTVEEPVRVVGMAGLVLPNRRQDADNDDSSMKMKLFRLMYETVRDSDLKVKRAELIKRFYTNSSSFEIGHLLGDVTDKFNVMTDISLTLKRLYREWKPIEHINAYEQVANLAIEISHIVDVINGVEKKLRTEEGTLNEDSKGQPDKSLTVFKFKQ